MLMTFNKLIISNRKKRVCQTKFAHPLLVFLLRITSFQLIDLVIIVSIVELIILVILSKLVKQVRFLQPYPLP
jgi:hypothetical protein